MVSTKKWMLGAAVLAGTLGLGASTAQAARVGIYIGGPVAYVPPCPGPGYQWVAGYYADGYWVPGRWAFVGVSGPVVGYGMPYGGPGYYRDSDRDNWRGDWRRDDQHFDRNHYRGSDDHEHFRR